MAIEDKGNNPPPPAVSADGAPGPAKARKQDPNLGLTLNNRYLIEKELGRGGIGVVYLARDQQLYSRPVVVKILLEGLEDVEPDPWLQTKFRQEMEALTRIDHPGVVGALDTGQMPNGKPYLVMEFITGMTLRSVMTVDGMDFARAAHIISQTGQALSAAHDQGVCHRDLKPENVMLQTVAKRKEQVKLIDFGIATVKDSYATEIKTTKVAGTEAYMAPEQLVGKPSMASDIYALGVMAYEMVTGRRPFNPDSPYQLLELQRAGVRVKPVDLRPSLPEAAQAIIFKALSFEARDRYTRAQDFGELLAHALIAPESTSSWNTTAQKDSASVDPSAATYKTAGEPEPAVTPRRVVLLYKRNAQPDEQVLKLLETQLLTSGHKVFIDRHLSIGVEWAQEIQRQVRSADAVIPLLSAASVSSEMLAYEVQIAHEAAQEQNGRPRLLPVRLNYEESLPDPLAAIFAPIQYALWQGPQDNQRLAAELLNSLQTPPPLKSAVISRKLEAIGGAVPLDSNFYVVRPTDEDFRTAIARQDSIVLVKGARQMGKTSLLARGLQQAREAGAKVVLTDFQTLSAEQLASVEKLFMTLGEIIADQLGLDVFPDEVWNQRRRPNMNFQRYLQKEVLEKLTTPLVWGLDEVDRLFTCDYGSQVFGLFRAWHNARALDPSGPWHRLTLAMAYATEAHLFITNLDQSPFNVGTRLAVDDFTLEQVAELNHRYGSPLKEAEEVARYFRLVSGHPYLVRRGLYEMVAHGTTLATFEALADRDEGPFGDHLRRILVLLAQDPALCDVVRGVLRGQPCPTPESFYRLRSAGVMAGDSAREIKPRCQLYGTYLKRHLL